MNNTYSIKDIINLLLSKLWVIILLAVIGGAGAFCYSKFILPLQYSSHISMYIQSYTSVKDNPEENYNNISNSKQLINTYMEVMKDDAVMNAVGDELKESFTSDELSKCFSLSEGKPTPSSLRSKIKITSVQDTSALNVVVTTSDPEVCAAVCNILAKVSPAFLDDAVGVGSISTIDVAKVNKTPVGPNVMKYTLIGTAAAMFLAMLIIFLIDFFDNTVSDSAELSEKYNKALLGELVSVGNDKKKRKKSDNDDEYFLITDEKAPFNIVESYKSLRTNITFALATTNKKIFAISSSCPGEGKSTVSANVAAALAQSGVRVLLIDADMRKAVQHKIFGLVNKKGLSTAVSKIDKPEDCISKNVIENLDVMTAGPIPPNPSELLASENMAKMLEDFSEEYQIIVIDTPPVNVVTDAMELSNSVSGIVMVVRYGVTKTDEIEAAVKKTELVGINMMGFIMNDIKIKKNGHYYSKYKYKSDYDYGYSYGKADNEVFNNEKKSKKKSERSNKEK